MKRLLNLVSLLNLLLFAGASSPAQVDDQIDWAAFLARHDLIWDRVPTDFSSGAFLGNGQLGANIFAGPGNSLRWHIGRTDVAFRGSRIPIGNLLLQPVGKITGADLRLDLWNAQVVGTLRTELGEIKFRSFTHSVQMVQVIEITPSAGEENCRFDWEPGLAVNPRLIFRHEKVPESETNPRPVRTDTDGIHVSLQPLRDGGGHATAWKETQTGKTRLLVLAIGFSNTEGQAQKEAITDIARAQSTGIEALTSSHQQWWHRYYPESFVSIPDTRLESFYWIQMYKLASATRSDRPALDLMGPWFNLSPWDKIWWNLNIQLAYWPVLTSNRLELGESLCSMLDKHAENLAANAKPFSTDSAAISRATGYDCVGTAGEELCNLTWVLHNYYLQYRYSMDQAMLRDRLFPLLKRSINFYLHNTKIGDDGKLHIVHGYSPEYPNQPKPDPDCNIDLALLRWGCQTLLQTCDELKIDDPLIPTWRKTLTDLTPYPVDENGLRISASVGFSQSHRHFSHLLMIFPLYGMTPEQPENRELVIKSLKHWMGMPQALQGYSYTGAASISALLGNGDDSLMYLNKLLDNRIPPNTLYQEAGPCIETPLSAAASLHDMLLSSWGDHIRVFPAVPRSWEDVSFEHLRTQGAFLVSAVRQKGKTQFVQVQSLAGAPCRIWTDIPTPVVDGNVPMTQLANGVLELKLLAGQSALIHPADQIPDLKINPVTADPQQLNFYGSHRKPAK